MTTNSIRLPILFAVALLLIISVGCGGTAQPDPPTPPLPSPLSASNVNLIFVVSEDLAYQARGDISAQTGNLTNRGLQRSLLMGSFLQQSVLGGNNVTAIYALEPMTHMQTASKLPDMAALETVQQFAMLNQITLSYQSSPPLTANSYAVNASYSSSATVPDNVAPPVLDCDSCQGLDFRDDSSDNEALADRVVKANLPGFYVFSAPWETVSAMLTNLSKLEGYNLALPSSYAGPNTVYAISIAPSGTASLVTYNGNLNPASTYPAPALPKNFGAPCTATPFSIKVTGGTGGAVIPAGVNTNETVYMIRHAEAHPEPWWEDGNYVGPGQWRALELPNALRGKINPDIVYAIDPAQVTPGSDSTLGAAYFYVRVALTVEPFAIANNLPYTLAASYDIMAQNPPQLSTVASQHIFTGGQFSNHTLLIAWEHDHIPPTVNALLASYHGGAVAPTWPDKDYDAIWTVKLDGNGNVSVDNNLCEGINTAALPPTPPQF